jgi:hypothetical protein
LCIDFIVRLLETRDIAYNESLKRFKAGRPGDLPCNKTVPLDFVMINVTVSEKAEVYHSALTCQPGRWRGCHSACSRMEGAAARSLCPHILCRPSQRCDSSVQLPKAGIVELDFIEPKHPAASTPLLDDAIDMVLLARPNGRRWIDWKLQVGCDSQFTKIETGFELKQPKLQRAITSTHTSSQPA